MKYTPTYFNFDALEHKYEILEIFSLVAGVYAIIFAVAWLCSKVK